MVFLNIKQTLIAIYDYLRNLIFPQFFTELINVLFFDGKINKYDFYFNLNYDKYLIKTYKN